MDNFTTNTYEMKRDIFNFSEKISKDLQKPDKKFVADILYGIEKSGSILFSDIARALNEDNKLKNTVERLCDRCNYLSDESIEKIKEKYLKDLLVKLSMSDFYTRVSYDKKIISRHQFEVISKFLLEVRRMVYGLKKKEEN